MRTIIYTISSLVLFSLCAYDITLLNIYAMDVPFWDIWDLMPTGNFKHVFDFYNENMQFFYFIISEIIYRIARWNLRYFVFVSFIVYLIIIGIYWKILVATKKTKEIPIYPLFFVIMLTPMLGFNWLWALLVQTHTFILFFLLAIYFGFTKQDKKYSSAACAVCLFLSTIAMNVPLMIGGALAYIIKEIVNIKENGTQKCIRNCMILVITLIVLLSILSLFTPITRFIDVKLHNSPIELNYLKNISFYLINMPGVFSLANILNWKICIAGMIIHFGILAIVFFEQYKDKKMQSVWGIMFGILFCVCGVVAFRGGEVYSYAYRYIRHNEAAFVLVPATLFILFSSQKKYIHIYGAVLLCFMLYGMIQDMRTQRFQFFGSLFYKNGCLCLNHYWNLKTIDNWECTMNFPIPHKEGMEIGKKMNLSFIDTIRTCNQ